LLRRINSRKSLFQAVQRIFLLRIQDLAQIVNGIGDGLDRARQVAREALAWPPPWSFSATLSASPFRLRTAMSARRSCL
jgi:hypothetical protein